MFPLNGDQESNIDHLFKENLEAGINNKTNIKQYIFSTIDNVLGGGQSSTA